LENTSTTLDSSRLKRRRRIRRATRLRTRQVAVLLLLARLFIESLALLDDAR